MRKIILTVALLVFVVMLTACSSSSHTHDYELSDTDPVTCTVAGAEYYKCKSCESTYTKVIPAGHDWQASTCTTAKTCNRCHETDGDAPGHTYENGICTICRAALSLNLTVPTASAGQPLIIHNKKNNGEDIRSTYKITNIKCEYSGTSSKDITVTIILEGEKTEDTDYGKDRYSIGRINFRILDEDGYVVFTNTKDTMMLVKGEKFKNLKIALTGFNSEQKYTLEFFDYYS